MAKNGYVVVDLETTGLHEDRGDRIIEIAMLSLDPEGRFEDVWTSLVNPERSVGPTSIHHIRPEDVVGAPRFADLAPKILRTLEGRVFAGHNAAFDHLFLSAELHRMGREDAIDSIPRVCTMMQCRRFFRVS